MHDIIPFWKTIHMEGHHRDGKNCLQAFMFFFSLLWTVADFVMGGWEKQGFHFRLLASSTRGEKTSTDCYVPRKSHFSKLCVTDSPQRLSHRPRYLIKPEIAPDMSKLQSFKVTVISGGVACLHTVELWSLFIGMYRSRKYEVLAQNSCWKTSPFPLVQSKRENVDQLMTKNGKTKETWRISATLGSGFEGKLVEPCRFQVSKAV